MITTIIVVLLVLALLGAFPAWPHSANWGYFPSGLVTLILVVVLVGYLLGYRL